MLAGITVGGIAMEYDINVNFLFEWRKQYGRVMADNGSANIQHYCQ
jgi:transposase-like protein